jgi:HD-like signal output (HDOD) protein
MSSSVKNSIPANFTIPTLPEVVQKIASMLEDPNTGVKEISAVIQSDAPLTAKVLKIANSAYYGLQERCLSTQHAVSVLGVRVLRNVVMQASIIRQYQGLETGGFDLNALWQHSIMTAQACHFLAKRARGAVKLSPDEFYACGLLHDLGKVVLIDNQKKAYIAMLQRSVKENLPLHVVEQQELGFTHADVGHLIAVRWGLPPAVAAAIQLHHASDQVLAADPVVELVARTNLLVHHVLDGNQVVAAGMFDGRPARIMGLWPNDITAAVEFVMQSMSNTEV